VKLTVIAAAAALLVAGAAPKPGEAGAARGKALFESTKLGTNGKSCATCHAGGKRFAEVAETPDDELAEYVNSCIEAMLAGKPLPAGSDDLRALVKHVRAVAGAK
jgi:mono/diheme cytochrome c family protein